MQNSPLHARAALVVHQDRLRQTAERSAVRAAAPPSRGRLRIGRRVRVDVWLPLPARDVS